MQTCRQTCQTWFVEISLCGVNLIIDAVWIMSHLMLHCIMLCYVMLHYMAFISTKIESHKCNYNYSKKKEEAEENKSKQELTAKRANILYLQFILLIKTYFTFCNSREKCFQQHKKKQTNTHELFYYSIESYILLLDEYIICVCMQLHHIHTCNLKAGIWMEYLSIYLSLSLSLCLSVSLTLSWTS